MLRYLTERFETDNIRVIPTNVEQYILVQIGMLRFIDTYKFLAASLATLTDNLRPVA